jgi:hypothetical protein
VAIVVEEDLKSMLERHAHRRLRGQLGLGRVADHHRR